MRPSLLFALSMAFGAAALPQAPQRLTGGDAQLYVGTFTRSILILDEATEKVVGEIKMRTGIPRGMALARDRKRFYVMNSDMEQMEVVDIPSRAVIDTFKLSEGNKKVRIGGFEADPQNRYLILLIRNATRQPDRWEIGPPTLVQYDLAEHKVTRTIEWPKKEEREFARMLFSPDGRLLYFFSDADVLIYDTRDFKEVDKWELSRPLEPGLGRINFGSLDIQNEEPGFFTGLFNVQDAVNNRRIMGIARVNLTEKNVDFYALGPATGVSFTLAPGRKRGYGLFQQVGRYEFWSFDLENRRLAARTEFAGRPRMALRVSSNGRLLYIYQAGNTIDLYDAATYRHLRQIAIDGDMATDLYILPRSAGAR